jgi:hypothetical protein
VEKQSPFGRLGRIGEDNINTDLKGSRLGQLEAGLAEDNVE